MFLCFFVFVTCVFVFKIERKQGLSADVHRELKNKENKIKDGTTSRK